MYQERRLSHSSAYVSVFGGLKFRCMVCCCVYVCGVSFWLCFKYIILTFVHSLAYDQGFCAACGQNLDMEASALLREIVALF